MSEQILEGIIEEPLGAFQVGRAANRAARELGVSGPPRASFAAAAQALVAGGLEHAGRLGVQLDRRGEPARLELTVTARQPTGPWPLASNGRGGPAPTLERLRRLPGISALRVEPAADAHQVVLAIELPPESAPTRVPPVHPPAAVSVEDLAEANAELLDALEGVVEREREIETLEEELQETNRGVVALYAQLEEKNEALAEADRRKDEFLAMLAHELRNPLGAVSNALSLLQLAKGEGSAGHAERALEIAERQVENMSRLVDDLLDVARVTSGKISLQRRLVKLQDVVDRAVASHESDARDRRHTLRRRLPPAPLYAHGDDVRLEQILSNLVANALKYTPDGGTVEVELTRSGRQAVLRVRDDGIGMDAETLQRVFDLFAQAKRSIDRSAGGLGLGLTLTRSLVSMHGGDIEARSAGPDQGSEFEVRLPLCAAPERAVAESDPSGLPLPPSDGTPVVIVEDDPDARDTIADLLRAHGYEVEAVPDGRRGADLIVEQRPPVAVVDIGLPGLDGYEVARHVREQVGENLVKLVALTGYGLPGSRERAADAGFDAFLVKPVEPAALLAALQR